jgi:hypothetical protein
VTKNAGALSPFCKAGVRYSLRLARSPEPWPPPEIGTDPLPPVSPEALMALEALEQSGEWEADWADRRTPAD